MPENDLRPWVPGYMVLEVLSTRPSAPWKPTTSDWMTVERIAREAIMYAAARSYWQMQKRNGNGDR